MLQTKETVFGEQKNFRRRKILLAKEDASGGKAIRLAKKDSFGNGRSLSQHFQNKNVENKFNHIIMDPQFAPIQNSKTSTSKNPTSTICFSAPTFSQSMPKNKTSHIIMNVFFCDDSEFQNPETQKPNVDQLCFCNFCFSALQISGFQ